MTKIHINLAHIRKPAHCACGRFVGSPLCQCVVDRVRRDMATREQIEIELNRGKLPAPMMVDEVACCEEVSI